MSSEWRTASLLDHYEVRSGLSKPAKDFGSGYPFLTFKDVFYNYFTPEHLGDFVQATEKEREGCSILRGDVFLTRTSETMHELGMSCVALRSYKDATFNGFCKRLRPKPGSELLPEYVGYYLRSPVFRQAVSAMSTMSTRASLNNEMIGRLEISFPPREVQVRISETLKSLDDRITLLRETNATLEAIAQALFKSWFVDFDPVRAKAEGRARQDGERSGQPRMPQASDLPRPGAEAGAEAQAQPEGMDAATAALFPDSFEESELGLVPKGWKVKPVGDAVDCLGGGTPDTKEPSYWEPAEHCWTTPKDLSDLQSPVLLRTERQLSTLGLAKVSSGLLPAGTLLLSSRAPIGYLAIAQMPVAVNQGYIAIPRGGELSPLYMLFWCRQNMDAIKGRANGSTFMEISKKAFRPIPALVPKAEVLEAFANISDPLFESLIENERQAQTLTQLRDTLLPRLISGQLRLPDAMEAIADTLPRK